MAIRSKFLNIFLSISIIPLMIFAWFTYSYINSSGIMHVDILQDIIFISAFILVIVIIWVTHFFVDSVTKPILKIASVAGEVRNGNFSKRANVISNDEIGDLAKGFNTMLDSLEQTNKQLEKKVLQRTEALEESNKDLESFTYSVSHDLRAPLRAIDGFSQILEENYSSQVDTEGKQIITTIRRSTQEMSSLIDDLLAFSRLGDQAITIKKISMKKMVKNVFEDLTKMNQNRTISFMSKDLPDVQADPVLMRQVWINLLSNAIKFTEKRENARIIVGSKLQRNNISYFVKDNGVGFNMKYTNKLFAAFQRLHSPQEFEGNGVGLAIVSRVVMKHGGKVWAEAKSGKGATFYFSLPKKMLVLNKL